MAGGQHVEHRTRCGATQRLRVSPKPFAADSDVVDDGEPRADTGSVGLPDLLHSYRDRAVVRATRNVDAGNSSELCSDGTRVVSDVLHHATDDERTEREGDLALLGWKDLGLPGNRARNRSAKGFLAAADSQARPRLVLENVEFWPNQ